MDRQSAAHTLTVSGMCGVFAVTLIWIVQNYLQVILCLIVPIIAIHFCVVSWTPTSPNFNMFRTLGPRWCQSHLLLLAMFHHFVSFICCQWEYCSKSVCWPTKHFMKSSLCVFTTCFPYHAHPVQWDQAKTLVCQSLGSRSTQVQELFTLVLRLFGTTCRCLSTLPFQLLPSTFKKHLDTSIWLGLPPPLDTGAPDSPLMLWNCFIDFAFEHWFSCRATEPGFAAHIGAI